MTRLNRYPARPFGKRRKPAYPRLLGIAGLAVVAAAACSTTAARRDDPDVPGPEATPGGRADGGERPVFEEEPQDAGAIATAATSAGHHNPP